MNYHFIADIIVLLHFTFIVFTLFGGILSIWWKRVIWLHIPAVLWSALIEFAGWICPLTFLEYWLRVRGGQEAYSGGFIEHYILPILYPDGLTRKIQIVLGVIVIAFNLLIYLYVFMVRNKRHRKENTHD
jgi:hypothetical protein